MKSVRFAPSFFLKARILQRRGFPVNSIVFDVAGTLVDPYTQSVVFNIRSSVQKVIPSLLLTEKEIRAHMGLKKTDHLEKLFRIPSVQKRTVGLKPDMQKIHDLLERSQIEYYEQNPKSTELLPGVHETLDLIRRNNRHMQFSLTTGFHKSILDCVFRNMHDNNNNYYHHYFVSTVASDEVKKGRPAPDMILKAVESHFRFPFLRSDVQPIINLGDTAADIQTGVAAKCISGAVLRWSNSMALHKKKDKNAFQKTGDEMFDAGADFTIDSMEDLPCVLRKLCYE